MNILIAANYATPQSGNFIASMVELGSALRAEGHHPFFIFPDCPNTRRKGGWVSWLTNNGYPVHLVDKSRSEKDQLQELLSIIHEHQVDILHTHFALYQHLILKHRKALPVKIVVHDHSGFLADRSRLKQRAFNTLLSIKYLIRGIYVIGVNAAKDRSFLFCRHLFVANGLSLKRNISKTRTKEECRSELGMNAEDKVCLFLGWDLHRKGLDIALKAIDTLRKTDSSVILGFVGVGNPPSPRVAEYIRTHTSIDPDAPWIHYLPDTEDMFSYHRMADVYLSASRSEGFPYGVMEAISQDTPVVCSNIQPTRWAQQYNRAFFYPTEDAAACADALGRALNTKSNASNYQVITQEYGIDAWCRQVISIYNSL